MKNLLLLPSLLITFCTLAQVHSAMPPEADLFYNRAIPIINPAIKKLIEKNAVYLKTAPINTDSLSQALKNDPLLKKMKRQDIDAIAVLILVQASKNADSDLKNMVLKSLRHNNERFKEDSTRSLLEHKSKIAEGITLVMKKIDASQQSAINNLK